MVTSLAGSIDFHVTYRFLVPGFKQGCLFCLGFLVSGPLRNLRDQETSNKYRNVFILKASCNLCVSF